MPEPSPVPKPSVYQLRVVVRGISPLIWRRLLVAGGTSVSELHTVLQVAFGWSDEHLNRFVVHGRDYGVLRLGGIGFPDDPAQVRLADLGLRPGERFLYEYDFTDGWQTGRRSPPSARAPGAAPLRTRTWKAVRPRSRTISWRH
jgi:hypothetical protein